jgi:hypothetical protein
MFVQLLPPAHKTNRKSKELLYLIETESSSRLLLSAVHVHPAYLPLYLLWHKAWLRFSCKSFPLQAGTSLCLQTRHSPTFILPEPFKSPNVQSPSQYTIVLRENKHALFVYSVIYRCLNRCWRHVVLTEVWYKDYKWWLIGMWAITIVAYFEVISRHSLRQPVKSIRLRNTCRIRKGSS